MKNMFNVFSKLVVISLLLVFMGIPVLQAASATNNLYTATVSTFAVTDTGKLTDINLSHVKIKSITLTQTAAVAQNVTIYQNFNSTTTATAVYVYAVPGTIGTYEVFPFSRVSTVMTSADCIDIPYFAVRSSTSTSASSVIVNVNYWK